MYLRYILFRFDFHCGDTMNYTYLEVNKCGCKLSLYYDRLYYVDDIFKIYIYDQLNTYKSIQINTNNISFSYYMNKITYDSDGFTICYDVNGRLLHVKYKTDKVEITIDINSVVYISDDWKVEYTNGILKTIQKLCRGKNIVEYNRKFDYLMEKLRQIYRV